jgi:hypothetical protein
MDALRALYIAQQYKIVTQYFHFYFALLSRTCKRDAIKRVLPATDSSALSFLNLKHAAASSPHLK